jgi:hypothetical protein
MDIDQSAIFFVGSILTCMGFIVVALTVLLLNNIFSKYWKPIQWRVFKEFDYHYTFQQEPKIDDKQPKQDDKPRA